MRESIGDPVVKIVLEAVDGFVLILNSQRQVLAANQELLDALGRTEPSCLVGLRPGEAVNCIHFTEGPDGCGTSAHCRSCGAAIAILASQKSKTPVTGECRLSVYRDGALAALELRVRASPLHLGGHDLTAFVLHDVSAVKRREVLERTFFHDALNAIGGIQGWSSRLEGADPQTAAREILSLVEGLKEEIVTQQTLVAAESGALVAHTRDCSAAETLERLEAVFDRHPVRTGKRLEIAARPAADPGFHTDRSLLLRVLVNMVKNAFEAIGPGEAVRVWFERREDGPAFVVQNPGVIPDSVRPHIFERSYSTKAAEGRGVGTYSMKLYGERRLGGKVTFTSDAENGTRFSIALPAGPSAARGNADRPEPVAEKRVLLADDQEAVLRLAGLFLSRLGYSPSPCGSGREALELFSASPERFGAVIADLSMPGMDGLELARRIAALRPGIPIFITTGYGESDILMDGAQGVIRGVIRKPFTQSLFAEALGGAFSGPGNP